MYILKCKQCNNDRQYKSKDNYNRAIKKDSVCRVCAGTEKYKKIFLDSGRQIKEKISFGSVPCPRCGNEREYKNLSNYKQAIRKNSICRKCIGIDRKTDVERNQKIREAAYKQHGTVPSEKINPFFTDRDVDMWAIEIKKRDNYTCQYCFCKGGKTKYHAHHILSKSKHPELALILNNGITLCNPCHKQEHKTNGII